MDVRVRATTRDDALRRGLFYFVLIGGTRLPSSRLFTWRRVPATRLERGVLQSATSGKLRTTFGISVLAFFEIGARSRRAWVNCLWP